jgi:hypothetical protein
MSYYPYFEYDDPTEINKEQIEKPYQAILTAIDQTYQNADEWHTYRETIDTDISPKEIDDFMLLLNYQEFLDIKMLRVDSTEYTEQEDIAEINNHIKLNPDYKTSIQKVYYIKGSKNHLVLIPVRKNQNQLFIFTQIFHMTPKLIQEANEGKTTDLKLVDYRDLKPKKKPNT